MAKSMREALLEQMEALQERGLAPTELPRDEETESAAEYASYVAEPRPEFTARRERPPRRERERAERGDRPERVERERPERERERAERSARQVPAMRPSSPGRSAAGPRPAAPSGPAQASPAAPRPQQMPQMGVADRLRQRAEQRRREEAERKELRDLVTTLRGEELNDEAFSSYLGELTQEVGSLPPLHVVITAMRNAGTTDPRKVGDEVRAYYRRGRRR